MHICGNVYGPSGVVPATTNFIFRRREEDSEVAKEYSFGNTPQRGLQSAFLVKGVPFAANLAKWQSSSPLCPRASKGGIQGGNMVTESW